MQSTKLPRSTVVIIMGDQQADIAGQKVKWPEPNVSGGKYDRHDLPLIRPGTGRSTCTALPRPAHGHKSFVTKTQCLHSSLQCWIGDGFVHNSMCYAGACKATLSSTHALANNQGYEEMYECMNSSCSCQCMHGESSPLGISTVGGRWAVALAATLGIFGHSCAASSCGCSGS